MRGTGRYFAWGGNLAGVDSVGARQSSRVLEVMLDERITAASLDLGCNSEC